MLIELFEFFCGHPEFAVHASAHELLGDGGDIAGAGFQSRAIWGAYASFITG